MNSKTALEKLNAMNKNTLMETLDITYTEVGDGYLVATMPVNSRVHQPMGLLHGGATVALAESLGTSLQGFSCPGVRKKRKQRFGLLKKPIVLYNNTKARLQSIG